MSNPRWMQRFARWHIWLGWLVGVPLIIWTLSGLVMVARPIEEVRGDHLRIERPPQRLTEVPAPPFKPGDPASMHPVELRTTVQRDQPVTRATYADGHVERYTRDGNRLPPLTERDARLTVAEAIHGGDKVVSVRFFPADAPPLDFRRPEGVWQVALEDGTHVYVGRDSGEIAAVRTRWWRVFDFMWGLHIMDLQTREDTSHPILILFAALALVGSLLGTTLLFRRRRARVNGAHTSSG